MDSRNRLQAVLQDAAEVRAGLRLHATSRGWCPARDCGATCACSSTWRRMLRSATRRRCCSRSAPKSRPPAATTSAGWSSDYRWPVVHREGLPRPVRRRGGVLPGRAGVQRAVAATSRSCSSTSSASTADLCGNRMPADMEFMDIRKGSDAEFGQSIYEPFGIAQVEPISFGGICVFTNVCGCAGFVDKAAGGKPTPNVDRRRLHRPARTRPAPRAAAEHRPAAARRRSRTRSPRWWRTS